MSPTSLSAQALMFKAEDRRASQSGLLPILDPTALEEAIRRLSQSMHWKSIAAAGGLSGVTKSHNAHTDLRKA